MSTMSRDSVYTISTESSSLGLTVNSQNVTMLETSQLSVVTLHQVEKFNTVVQLGLLLCHLLYHRI